jgi:uncharacterized protein (TIGR03086 family)
METNQPETMSMLTAAVPVTSRLIARIMTDQWRAATPCEGMDVIGLVSHLVAGLEQFAALPMIPAHGPTDVAPAGPPDSAGSPPDPKLEPHEAAAAYVAAGGRMLEAWSAAGALARMYPMPWGDTAGATLVGFMVIEQVTHGWDIARATAQKPLYSEELVAGTLALAGTYDDSTIRVPGMFGPAVDTPVSAPTIDRLAAFLGRHP